MCIYDETHNSPNWGYPRGKPGRNGHKIIGIGVHIGGGSFRSNYNHIMNAGALASYNAYVKLDGSVVQFVAEENPAWSHGKIVKPTWPLLKSGVNPNLYTLSISREGSNQNLWQPEQMISTIKVIKHWANKYNIPLKRPHIFGHFEIDSVGRWYCPGRPFFDALIKELEKEDEPLIKPEAVWFRVIAGSYRDRDNAEMMRKNLLRQGIGAFIEVKK
jgi:hypothetical protein